MKNARKRTTAITLSPAAAMEGLCLTWDLATFSMHALAAKRATSLGIPAPTAPAPISKLLQGFMNELRDRAQVIDKLLDPSERERLSKLRDGFADAVNANDPDVVELITHLMQLPPEVVACWIRQNLEGIEQRFAS